MRGQSILKVWPKCLGRGPLHGTVCFYAQPLRSATSQEGMGRMASSSFFLLKQERRVFSELVRFPSISAEKVKACALIGLLMMAEENSWRSDSGPTRSCEDTRSQSRCEQRMTETKESFNMECFDGEIKV